MAATAGDRRGPERQPLMARILDGRTALVTGASRGIGLATVRALVDEGVRVAMLARGAAELHARASELGDRALPIACDVADATAVRRAEEQLRALFGAAPDIVVNNAGVFELATVEETPPDDFVRTLEVNLVAPFLIVRAFIRDMRERGSGHVVTIGSIADRHTFPENGAYAASKFGARALHEVVRAELRGTGVRVSLVSPGPVDTKLWDQIGAQDRPGIPPRSARLDPGAVASAVRYALTQPPSVNIDELRLSHA